MPRAIIDEPGLIAFGAEGCPIHLVAHQAPDVIAIELPHFMREVYKDGSIPRGMGHCVQE